MACSADAALTAGVRSLRVAFDGAAAARALFSGELEALSAFGTRRYTAQAMQVMVPCSLRQWGRCWCTGPDAMLLEHGCSWLLLLFSHCCCCACLFLQSS